MKRKIILLSLLCYIIATATAQNYVVHRYRDNVTPSKEHLAFEGIAINGHEEDFLNKLKKKNYKIQTKAVEEGEYYQSAIGKYANIDGWEIFVDCDDDFLDSIYCVRLYSPKYVRWDKQMDVYANVKKYIETHYAISGKAYLWAVDLFAGDTETIYKIGEKGTITVTCGFDEGERYIAVVFKDEENERKYGYHPIIKKYSLTNVSPNFQKCFIESSELETKYDVLCDNIFYTFLSRGKDGQLIQQLLNGNYDDKMKIFVISNYVNNCLNYCKESKEIPIVENECEVFCRQYIDAVKKIRRETVRSFTPRDAILEYLRQKIFSPSERQTLDKVIPPEMMRGLIGGAINFMGSGKEGYYTDYEKYINPYAHD